MTFEFMQKNNLLEYIVTFHTHSGALKCSKYCKACDIPCVLMPVPRKLSSSCGVCAKISSTTAPVDFDLMDGDKVYRITNDIYELVYDFM